MRLLACLLLFATVGHAHESFVSIGRADLDADSGTVEIALRLDDRQLREALGPDGDDRLTAFVFDHVALTAIDGGPLEPEWLGAERTPQGVWVYFSVALPGDVVGTTMTNRVFFDQSPLQTNTVNWSGDGDSGTFVFTASEPHQRFDR